MSEPLGVEERARLRLTGGTDLSPQEQAETVLALLDEVASLTEALEAAEEKLFPVGQALVNKQLEVFAAREDAERAASRAAQEAELGAEARARAERAEADLAERDSRIKAWEGIEERLKTDLADRTRELDQARLDVHNLIDDLADARRDADYLQAKWDAENARAITAEHDLADEKRRRAKADRIREIPTLTDAELIARLDNPRALLDTATEETGTP